jgi:hypothetical protein
VRTVLAWTADSPLAELAEDIHVRLLTIRTAPPAEHARNPEHEQTAVGVKPVMMVSTTARTVRPKA